MRPNSSKIPHSYPHRGEILVVYEFMYNQSEGRNGVMKPPVRVYAGEIVYAGEVVYDGEVVYAGGVVYDGEVVVVVVAPAPRLLYMQNIYFKTC